MSASSTNQDDSNFTCFRPTDRDFPRVESFDQRSAETNVMSSTSRPVQGVLRIPSPNSVAEQSFITEVARPMICDFSNSFNQLPEFEIDAHLTKYAEQDGKYSFWHSLLLSENSIRCHKEAVKFITAYFEDIKILLAETCYEIFNKTLFKKMMPQGPKVQWIYCGVKIGRFKLPNLYSFGIFCVDEPFKVATVMLHLMCQAAIYEIKEPAYSNAWNQWTELAKSMFPELIQPKERTFNTMFHDVEIFLYKRAKLKRISPVTSGTKLPGKRNKKLT